MTVVALLSSACAAPRAAIEASPEPVPPVADPSWAFMTELQRASAFRFLEAPWIDMEALARSSRFSEVPTFVELLATAVKLQSALRRGDPRQITELAASVATIAARAGPEEEAKFDEAERSSPFAKAMLQNFGEAPLEAMADLAWFEPREAPACPPGPSCPPGMAFVPGGSFPAANRPEPVLSVAGFCMDVTEVTVEAYAACVRSGACAEPGLSCGASAAWGKPGLERHPITCVALAAAQAYCAASGKRLPTEGEWERAARGGRNGWRYPWGNGEPERRACWNGERNTLAPEKRQGSCAVGSFPAGDSPQGLHDLAGNVHEWVAPPESEPAIRRTRGGSWDAGNPAVLTASFREIVWQGEGYASDAVGFRCVRAP